LIHPAAERRDLIHPGAVKKRRLARRDPDPLDTAGGGAVGA
jgi:hypothetical protein